MDDELLNQYDPVSYTIDGIADEVEDAAEDAISNNGTDIDLVADITDKDVEEIAPQLEREPDIDFLDDDIDEDEVVYTTINNDSNEPTEEDEECYDAVVDDSLDDNELDEYEEED